MENDRRRVLIWRQVVLPPSETFIANQAAALRRWEPRFASYEVVPNDFGIIPDVQATSSRDPALRAALRTSDLVHAHFGPDAAAIAPAATLARTPLIVTFHGYDAAQDGVYEGRRAQLKLRFMFARARAIIAVSGFIADRVIELGAPAKRVVRHHIGIPLPTDVPDTQHRAGVLFVGRLVDKKGCDDLLAAVAGLPGELRQTRVTIIGDGPVRAELERQAAQLGLAVDFRGVQSNELVRAEMRRAAVLCAPSRRAANGDAEGLPITILEAAAHRLPVVSTTSSGIPEAITDGESGLLVAERDRAALTQALGRALSDGELRRRLAAVGRTVVETHFDIVKQTALLEDIYDRAAS